MTSMRVRTTPSGFAAAMTRIVDEVADAVSEDADRAAREGAREAVSRLKSDSPRKTGGYAAGWTASRDGGIPGRACYVVHNASKPQLTHLLEMGHMQWWMGHPTGRRTPGIPHIADAGRAGGEAMMRDLR